MKNAFISIEKLTKRYKTIVEGEEKDVEIIKNFSLEIKKGEFITFFGPNGCGKTTFLNILAGLSDSDGGEITIGGKPSIQSNIGYVFQNSQNFLLPWRNNLDNIAFPLELQKITIAERIRITKELILKLGINIPMERYPYQLSGGQQKLLSIVQAIINKPDVLLMDEPFSSLDFSTRMIMQEKILDLWEKTGSTILLVSHDIDEAIFLANRLILLNKRPSSVSEIFEINFNYPRNIKLMQSPEFIKVRNSILEKVYTLINQ